MRLKTVALAGALGPSALGCNIAQYTTHTLVNEVHVLTSLHGVEHKLRSEARDVWKEVRAQYPRRAFTAEFRDGFLDGYADYLDRGGNCSVPPVPPAKYTRQKKYFTEEGQCLLKDYLLGFKYGQDIAVATGKRQFLTVPVLVPVVDDGPPQFRIAPRADADPLPTPAPVTMPAPTPPPAPAPTAKPAPQRPLFPPPAVDAAGAGSSLNPPRAAVAAPPAPPAPAPTAPPAVVIPTAPAVGLPAPPADVPEFPEFVPTPPVTDELPIVPPNRTELPVVPPSHPQ
jgi:hypothetical protein